MAPHALYVIEAKEWYGRITGDDTEWLINQTPKKCPLWLVDQKCKVLKTRLGAIGNQLWVEPLLAIPDTTKNYLTGNWGRNVYGVRALASAIQDLQRIRFTSDLGKYHDAITGILQGAWAARRRDRRRRIAGFEIVETLAADEESGEFLAKRALVADPTPYRIRTWYVSPYLDAADRRKRVAVISRPTEALARIGRHANLLPILDFAFSEDDNEYYEVTEWSEFGTLHGYLRNSGREPLTTRERLEIAGGVASALEAVHAHGLVHRNVCPETILIGFDRLPRLTDFDRAYLEKEQTVFPHTATRQRNLAYLAPELKDTSAYESGTYSDMYSFGVLLYELLTGEVPFQDPKAAIAASGRPSKLPSEIREGVEQKLDELVLKLLKVGDAPARPSAPETTAILRDVLGSSAAAGKVGTAESTEPSFAPGSVVNGNLRIEEKLGTGAFSRVYKVFHLDQLKVFAMKILARSSEADVILHEFRDVGDSLPTHPNIARMVWMDRLAPPLGTPYILSEYVDGETLEAYCDGRKHLSWSDIRRIGAELLDALDAMHPTRTRYDARREELKGRDLTQSQFDELQKLEQEWYGGILHRDIKPANIILELPTHKPKLIDFNIASQLKDAVGRAGTPRYWAPDRGLHGWRPDMDLFSLGVVLYELVTHRHPFRGDDPEAGTPVDPRDFRSDISPELAAFLVKAVQPSGPDRFESAREMKTALLAVSSMHAPAPVASPVASSLLPGLTLAPEEVGKPNYNPYVTRLLTLYSQARRTNSGTRGLDEIAKLTYVRTRLDDHLAPAVADGRFRLVIVTGNAGDGKTAFLQQVEHQFLKLGAAVETLEARNGSRWTYHGLEFETNYDGSQDEGDIESDDVLARFLEPFASNLAKGLTGSAVRLLAVNEGRLLDFLEHSTHRERFTNLRDVVHRGLEAEEGMPDGLLVVNLNLRSVAAGGADSLLERQLLALLAPTLWAPCGPCAYRDRCPLKFNADSLSDIASGPAVRMRVRRLFEVVHLRRRTHVTIRDLRSALSWLLLRDQSCDDVEALLNRQHASVAGDLVRMYYPAAFAEDGKPQDTVDDRLVRLLREADVGLVSTPQLDRRLDYEPASAVPWMSFEGRSAHGRTVLNAWTAAAPKSVDDAPLDQLLGARRRIIAHWRRWAYFERRDDGWEETLPYRSLGLLEAVMNATSQEAREHAGKRLRDVVVEAISLSEGLRHPSMRRGFLALRVSHIRTPTVRSYRLFPADEFDIRVAVPGRVSAYLEYAPDAVELVAPEHRGVASLRIPLDLLEMLELIRSGYRPSPGDLQGLFVNLVIFRNELLNLPYDRIMLTPDDEDLYELTATVGAGNMVKLDLRHLPEHWAPTTEASI
jgi:serine/threonine protein kinase